MLDEILNYISSHWRPNFALCILIAKSSYKRTFWVKKLQNQSGLKIPD